MEVNHADNPLSEAYATAPSGDTILVVGEKQTKLLVHSVFMRTASTVFDAMLGPHFSEGQPSKGAFPKEISIPDDDARAMTTLCSVIHHRNDILPDVLEPTALADLALLADKYDCVLALKYAMNLWLDFKEPITFSNLGKLLIAAYVFDNSKAFRRVTQRLITGFSHSYHWLFEGDYDNIIPWPDYRRCISLLAKFSLLLIVLSDSLETARTYIRASLQELLLKEVAECCHHPVKKGYSHRTTDNVVRSYSDFWGTSLFKMPIDDAIQKAREMVQPNAYLDHSGSILTCSYNEQEAMERRYSKLEGLKESAGLCLRCVRSGNTDANGLCKVDHKDRV